MRDKAFKAKHNICAIIADSLRWDVFVEAKPVNIPRLGPVKKARSFACCTLPSIMGFLMNYPPIGVGRGFFHEGGFEEEGVEDDAMPFRRDVRRAVRRWMPRYFGDAGYVTIWLSGNAVPLRLNSELDGAFQKYFDYFEGLDYMGEKKGDVWVSRDIATPDIIRDLDAIIEKEREKPIFAVILLLDTHTPYHNGKGVVHPIDSSQPDINRHWQIQAMKYTDRIFANFVHIFSKTGRPTEFIFTSDHGEMFGGQSFGHDPFASYFKFSPDVFAIPFVRGKIEDWSQVKIITEEKGSLQKILDNNREVWNELHRKGYWGYSGGERVLKSLDLLLGNIPEGWITQEKKVLDIGCGKGDWMRLFASMAHEIHGVDISKEAIALGRQQLADLENVHFHVTEGDNLSMFEDEVFDLVYSMQCFQHIPKAVTFRYFLEVRRVMKPSGYFVFQVITKPTRNQLDVEFIATEETIGFSHQLLTQMIGESGLKLEAINPQTTPKWHWFWVVARKGQNGGVSP